jgi:anti-sigma regulatory factor (Ser/Thr protein kinase)
MATQALKLGGSDNPRNPLPWIFSAGLLAAMYSLLFLSQTEEFPHMELMERCVLMDPRLSRIWSVANVEIGVSYFGVFAGMTYYLISMRSANHRHLNDLSMAFTYLILSFGLDYECVQHFSSPFLALLVGDAIVMTFTLLVSRELWFQRLLGVFVPLIFFTCACGHLMEGMSYWHLTYRWNVPCAMVTADVGFAVLVNSSRFPAFIKGADVQEELDSAKRAASAQHRLFRDVLYSVTDGKLRFHLERAGLPAPLSERVEVANLGRETLSAARAAVTQVAAEDGFSRERTDLLATAVGEGFMNAVVHGKDARMMVRSDGNQIQVWIEDAGTGIPLEDLPNATLQKGWSSRGTMGIGFPLMLSTSDGVDIVTSDRGTSVVITMYREAEDALRLPYLGGGRG